MLRRWHYCDFQLWRRLKVHSTFYLIVCHPNRSVLSYGGGPLSVRKLNGTFLQQPFTARGRMMPRSCSLPRWLVDYAVRPNELADRLYTLQHFCSTLFLSPLFSFSHYWLLYWLWFARICMVGILSLHWLNSFRGKTQNFRPRLPTRTYGFDFWSLARFCK